MPVQHVNGLQAYDYAMFAYFAAYVLYVAHAFFSRRRGIGSAATLLLLAGFALHTVFLVERSMFYYVQHQGFVLPATNMFEAISYFCWLIVLVYLIAEKFFLKTRVFGVFTLLMPAAGMAYTARAMTPDPRELMPSLKSYWLVFHVTAMFISYAIFALAFTFGLMYIMRAHGVRSMERIDPKYNLKFLEDTSARLIVVAFPVLTLGIFLGAVWADSAWGRYWGWDPKEVWALITWFIYLAYLHLRFNRNWSGYKSSLFNCIGFVSVLVTFQGVNLLDSVFKLNSIHAYAEGGGTFMLTVLGLALLIPIAMNFIPMPKDERLREEQVLLAGGLEKSDSNDSALEDKD